MNERQNNTIILLRQIVEQRGLAFLREGGGKFFVNAFAEMGGEKQDEILLRYLIQCGGHEDLLDAGELSPAMQRTYYSQVVQKLCDKTLIPDALAHRVCSDFWQAVYGKEPPVVYQRPKEKPVPEPDPVHTLAKQEAIRQQSKHTRLEKITFVLGWCPFIPDLIAFVYELIRDPNPGTNPILITYLIPVALLLGMQYTLWKKLILQNSDAPIMMAFFGLMLAIFGIVISFKSTSFVLSDFGLYTFLISFGFYMFLWNLIGIRERRKQKKAKNK